jgi:hypothetical protein
MLEYTEKEKVTGIIFTADYAAAFDSIEYSFIIATLKLFGFPEYFIDWVKIIQTETESSVINNGYSTGYFSVSRGCRQGDPLSPYTFVLVIEILSNIVQNDNTIKGITMGNQEVKLVMFADDSTFFLKDEYSLENLNKILSTFEKFSSLKLNHQKSEVAWLGTGKDNKKNLKGYKNIDLNTDCLKILGVYFTYNKNLHIKNNFDRVQDNLVSTLRHWNLRNLSIFGRVTVLNTVVIPKINYVSNVLIPPAEFVNRLRREVKIFYGKMGHQRSNIT